MRMPSYKTGILSAAMIGLGYLASPNSAYSQRDTTQVKPPAVQTQKSDSTKTQADTGKKVALPIVYHNRLLSRNPEYSATGEGIFLKDFVLPLYVTPNSTINLNRTFGLYAQHGGSVSYNTLDRRGLEKRISNLRVSKPMTGEKIASIKYLESLKGSIETDEPSLRLFKRAVKDGNIGANDSLFVNGQLQIKNGRYYVIDSHSSDVKVNGKTYHGDTVPIFVDVKTPEVERPVAYDSTALKRWRDSVLAEARKDYTRDTAAAADVERKAGEDFVVDSLGKIKAREDYVRDSLAIEDWAKKQLHDLNKIKIGGGLEVLVGTNQELVVGGLVNFFTDPDMKLELYGNFYASRGKDPVDFESTIDTTVRETELIGPGTYKQRIDKTTTTTEERPVIEIGGGIFSRTKLPNLSLFSRLGFNLSEQKETIDGESEITFERNKQPIGEPKVIANTKDGRKKFVPNLSVSVGAIYNFYKNFGAGLSVNRVGDKLSGRLNLRYSF